MSSQETIDRDLRGVICISSKGKAAAPGAPDGALRRGGETYLLNEEG
jgi:hypothetical protein